VGAGAGARATSHLSTGSDVGATTASDWSTGPGAGARAVNAESHALFHTPFYQNNGMC